MICQNERPDGVKSVNVRSLWQKRRLEGEKLEKKKKRKEEGERKKDNGEANTVIMLLYVIKLW